MEDLKERIKQLESELEQFKWIDVNDRLPEKDSKIIVVTKRHGVKSGIDIGYKKPSLFSYPNEYQYTHWMQLPKAPL